MNVYVALILGLILGWIIEWVIDWIYWRRRETSARGESTSLSERLQKAEARSANLEEQLSLQKNNLHDLQEKLSATETKLIAADSLLENQSKQDLSMAAGSTSTLDAAIPQKSVEVPARVIQHDDLIVIKGIGPVIAAKLNQVGIYSFEDLAALSPEQLRGMVGDIISRLADENSIIEQAKQLAAEKSHGG